MEKKSEYEKKYFHNNAKKKLNAIKSINNYLCQLKMHFELSDKEMAEILKTIYQEYKKTISSKKWWRIFD